MERLEWNKILDRYLVEGTMSSYDYERMPDEYKFVIQEIKKAMARINRTTERKLYV